MWIALWPPASPRWRFSSSIPLRLLRYFFQQLSHGVLQIVPLRVAPSKVVCCQLSKLVKEISDSGALC
jgi:hypothetical protein